jgi:hypothetical protein
MSFNVFWHCRTTQENGIELHIIRIFKIYNLNLMDVMIKSRNVRNYNFVLYSEGPGSRYLSEDQLLRSAMVSEARAGKCWYGTLQYAMTACFKNPSQFKNRNSCIK